MAGKAVTGARQDNVYSYDQTSGLENNAILAVYP